MKLAKPAFWAAAAASGLFSAYLLGTVPNLRGNRAHAAPPTLTEVWMADALNNLGVKSSWADKMFQRSLAYEVNRELQRVRLKAPACEENAQEAVDEMLRILPDTGEQRDD